MGVGRSVFSGLQTPQLPASSGTSGEKLRNSCPFQFLAACRHQKLSVQASAGGMPWAWERGAGRGEGGVLGEREPSKAFRGPEATSECFWQRVSPS